jgi:hypothetical protein
MNVSESSLLGDIENKSRKLGLLLDEGLFEGSLLSAFFCLALFGLDRHQVLETFENPLLVSHR